MAFDRYRAGLMRGALLVVTVLVGCSSDTTSWEDRSEDGAFLMYRRQSLIGEESFTVTSDRDSIVVTAERIEGYKAIVHDYKIVLVGR